MSRLVIVLASVAAVGCRAEHGVAHGFYLRDLPLGGSVSAPDRTGAVFLFREVRPDATEGLFEMRESGAARLGWVKRGDNVDDIIGGPGCVLYKLTPSKATLAFPYVRYF